MNAKIEVSREFLRRILSLFGLVAVLICSQFLWLRYLQPGFEEIPTFNYETIGGTARLMWVPIISYLLVGSAVALTVNIFKPLKSMSEEGLVLCLVLGFFLCLICGIFGGLFGLVVGLVLGLVLGLAAGLRIEFVQFD